MKHMSPKQAMALDVSAASHADLVKAESVLFRAAMRAMPASPMQREFHAKYWAVRNAMGRVR